MTIKLLLIFGLSFGYIGSDYNINSKEEKQSHLFHKGELVNVQVEKMLYENYNPNYIGGDINAGVQNLAQLLTRPVTRLSPYTTPNKKLYLASSSVPPARPTSGTMIC